MKTSIEISNLTKKKIDPDFARKVVRKTVKMSGENVDCFDISIVFVGEAESRKINWKDRRKNGNILCISRHHRKCPVLHTEDLEIWEAEII